MGTSPSCSQARMTLSNALRAAAAFRGSCLLQRYSPCARDPSAAIATASRGRSSLGALATARSRLPRPGSLLKTENRCGFAPPPTRVKRMQAPLPARLVRGRCIFPSASVQVTEAVCRSSVSVRMTVESAGTGTAKSTVADGGTSISTAGAPGARTRGGLAVVLAGCEAPGGEPATSNKPETSNKRMPLLSPPKPFCCGVPLPRNPPIA
jgi:hypothetical protein